MEPPPRRDCNKACSDMKIQADGIMSLGSLLHPQHLARRSCLVHSGAGSIQQTHRQSRLPAPSFPTQTPQAHPGRQKSQPHRRRKPHPGPLPRPRPCQNSLPKKEGPGASEAGSRHPTLHLPLFHPRTSLKGEGRGIPGFPSLTPCFPTTAECDPGESRTNSAAW